ncbi:ion transporter [Zunongwangia sp.]|uniref:ion transporter n=1 Tax=Zunongwangia sp. TaxID=1965325 RepID=UPI003AA8EECA
MGKLFDIALLVLIVLSVILVMLESIATISKQYHNYFYIAEWIVTVFFTLEYIARIIVIKRPKKYIFSFYGIVDLLSTLPSYLGFLMGGHNLFFAIRALRLLRVFRILKITRYVGESHKLIIALKNSRPKILVFLFAVLIVCIITGTLMHLIEGKESGFTNIPISIYWCIVTLTTVGFGDIAPITPLGQFLAGLLMIMGYGIIAVPTGIVGAEFSKSNEESIAKNTQVCPHCNEEKHLSDADFCHNCGNKLNE